MKITTNTIDGLNAAAFIACIMECRAVCPIMFYSGAMYRRNASADDWRAETPWIIVK